MDDCVEQVVARVIRFTDLGANVVVVTHEAYDARNFAVSVSSLAALKCPHLGHCGI